MIRYTFILYFSRLTKYQYHPNANEICSEHRVSQWFINGHSYYVSINIYVYIHIYFKVLLKIYNG